jgi:hypothetical protein
MIDKFGHDKDTVNTMDQDLEVKEGVYLELLSKSKGDLSDEDIATMITMRDEVSILKKNISDIKTNKKELEYFINTSDILFNYYDLLENHTDEGGMKEKVIPTNGRIGGANTHHLPNIAQYFINNQPPVESNTQNEQSPLGGSPLNHEQTTQVVNTPSQKNPKNSRFHLLDDYLKFTDKNYIDNHLVNECSSTCSFCKGVNKDILVNEGLIYCRDCYTIENIITDNEKPSYKDPPKEISYFSYKRINHFSEWLNQIQGKETTDIPEEVFNKIILELNKQRVYNLAKVTPIKIREILKKYKINKYYEHIPYILNKITGIPNPHLSPDLEDTLKNMFKEIQVPFLKYSPIDRKNFLSYSYVLHKFIQILDRTEFLKHFPLLKSRDKLHQQEQIWKKICEDLGWKFIRSI